MDDRAKLRPGAGVAVVALLTVFVGAAAVGTGWVNGDAAVYASQMQRVDLAERTVHIGYILPGVPVAWLVGAMQRFSCG